MKDLTWTTQLAAIDALTPLESNPRTITDAAYSKLDASVGELGNFKPLIVDKDLTILAGNQRYQVLKANGYTELEVSVPSRKLIKRERDKIVLIDNLHAGEFDIDMLANEFEEELLRELDFDIPEPVIDTEEDGFNPDGAAENVHNVVLGDIWELGEHRLMCGDATNIDAIGRLVSGITIDLVVTDPPYGINVLGSDGVVGSKATKHKAFVGDDSTETARDAYSALATLNLPMIIWGGNYFTDFLPPSRNWAIWLKRQEDLRDRNDFADAEVAWCSFDGNIRVFPHLWNGWNKGEENGITRVHPTQKPIKLLTDVIGYYRPEAKHILDIFGGSGSTLIACEQTERKCYMMELDPHYCSVIIERWQKQTNQIAKRLNQ